MLTQESKDKSHLCDKLAFYSGKRDTCLCKVFDETKNKTFINSIIFKGIENSKTIYGMLYACA